MRLRTLASALVAVPLTSIPALAQGTTLEDGQAVRDFLTSPEALGATSATVGSVASDGEVVRVSDVAMEWSGEFSAEGGETLSIRASVTAPTLEVEGLERAADRYRADRISVPSSTLSVALTGGADAPLDYTLTVNDYFVENASWAPLPRVAADPSAPVSRFAPLLDWVATQSYDRVSLGRVSGRYGDGEQDIDYDGASFGPVDNGVLASFAYDEVVSTQTMPNPAMDPANPDTLAPIEVEVRYGPVSGSEVDIKPLIALFTGTDAADGPQQFLGSMRYEGIVVDGGDALRITVGPSVIEDLTIDPSRGPLMRAFDDLVVTLVASEDLDPAALLTLVVDMYGAMGIGGYALEDVDVAFMDGNAALAQFAIEEFGAAGLGRLALDGIDIDVAGTQLRVGAMEVGELAFPPREAVVSVLETAMAGLEMGGRPPSAAMITGALPTVGRVAVRDVAMGGPQIGSLRLGLFEARAENYVSAIPTSLTLVLDGLSMPAAMVQDPMTQQMLTALGADPVEADANLTLGWDEATQEVTLDHDMAVRGVGELTASTRLSGIPRVVFAEPSRAQEALVTAALDDLSLRFTDMGLTRFLLGMVAQQSGVSVEELVAGIAQQVALQVGSLTGDPALGASIATEVETFLSDPQSLAVTAAPSAPVPLAQIMGAAMTAPQALPGLMGFSITANGPAAQ
ncbi:hypothetical protein [Acuticoccus sp.]|uniref:hypothetical protein n=1 Tax=Acuticoccus sp. TaxID=1904378 RepID=UPI003B524A7A